MRTREIAAAVPLAFREREIPLYWFASLASLALTAWWLAELMMPLPERLKPNMEHSIDYYALEFMRTEMKPDGTPKTRLQAIAMNHYVDDNVAELTQPVMLFFNVDTPPWVVRSDTGAVSGDGNTLFLGGKAVLTRDAFGSSKALKVISMNVTVHMDQSYLESSEFTEIFNTPQYTSGTGMRTDFADGMKVKLVSDVRGRYAF